MTHLEKYLSALGLNDEQIELYLTLASSNPLTVLQLAQTTSIPRTTVYLYIEEMVKNGLLSQIEEGKKKRYTAVPVQRLLELIKNKKEQYEHISQEMESTLPELDVLYYRSTKPHIKICEGEEHIRKLFQEVLEEEKVYMMWTSAKRMSLDTLIEYLYDNIHKYLIHTKELVLADHSGKLHKIHNESLKNEVSLVPLTYTTEVDTLIFGHKVAYIFYTDPVMAFVIEDRYISHAEVTKFLALWEHYFQKE